MNLSNAILLGSLVLCALAPALTRAQTASSAKTASYPQPYMDSDRGWSKNPKFTLNNSGALPDWLSLAVQHRTRYETLDHAFRSGSTGSDQVLARRTLAQATLHLNDPFDVRLELQDSRAELADSGSAITPSIVNAAELLEANLQWRADGWFQDGSRSLLRAGRMTMDFGDRRLVARNRFRNTKNAFTGADWIWRANRGETVRVLFTLPVNRLPTASARLLQNDAAFDEETLDRIFWGWSGSTPNLPGGSQGELFLFGLHERDGADSATRNRELYTPGLRVYRPKKKGEFDYQWETVLQFGTSRASTAATDTRDLDHFASFHHAEAGYTFALAGSPRLVLAYDYASGDADPKDGNNGSFDTLFGASVFDYGPTGIHRAFARSNITGPGVKIAVRPHRQFKAHVQYRAFWLASDTDTWAGNSGLRDTGGGSGSFLGHMVYLAGSWQATDNLWMEGGMFHRIEGDFQDTVPNAPRQGDSTYACLAVTLSF